MKIWTEAYRPWILGGNCRAPVSCDVPVDGPFELGKGYIGYIATSPNGRKFVIESETGALIGSSLDGVREDIRSGDETVMKQQIEHAKRRALETDSISVELFWKLLKAV
jgi:hypothetical protein